MTVSAFLLIFLTSFLINDIEQAHEYALTDYDRCYNIARGILENDNQNFEAAWLAAVCQTRKGYREPDQETTMALYQSALTYAELAYEINPDHYASNYAMGMTLGRTAQSSSARERVAKTREIKKYADRALELNPEHAGSWMVYGQLTFRVANLSTTERLAANILFGGFPFEVTAEEGIEAMKNAVKFEPEFIYHSLQLARAYIVMQQEEKAKEVLLRAVELDPITPDDPGHLDTCQQLLNRIS